MKLINKFYISMYIIMKFIKNNDKLFIKLIKTSIFLQLLKVVNNDKYIS